jgi:hypothetical protein
MIAERLEQNFILEHIFTSWTIYKRISDRHALRVSK